MRIANHIGELIGNTPMLALNQLQKALGLKANLWAKIESYNPAGSIKDRVGWGIIEEAEKSDELKKGALIVEPTSGNTGIGLAMAARVKGYKAVLVMPDTMSMERIQLLKAYGAQVVLTEGVRGMQGAIEKAEEIVRENPGAFMARQFENPVNPLIHERTTAEEIWRDTDGMVDILVAGMGTGGTISGTARGLKKHKDTILAFAVEPQASPLLTKGIASNHKIQGIGANFIPKNYDASVIDGVIDISDEEAYDYTKTLAVTEGILCGISSGAALAAAIKLAQDEKYFGKNIVLIFPDGGDKYMSLNLYN